MPYRAPAPLRGKYLGAHPSEEVGNQGLNSRNEVGRQDRCGKRGGLSLAVSLVPAAPCWPCRGLCRWQQFEF